MGSKTGIQEAVDKQKGARLQPWSLLVCILSADKGTVQKVIVLPRDDLLTEELVLEEVEVFKVSFCQALTCLLFASYLPVSFSFVAMTFNSQFHYLFPVKVPTPITTMKISSKRVSLVSAADFSRPLLA